MKRRVVFIAYQGAELLDIAGPAGVFSTASELAQEPLYDLCVASTGGGLVRHRCGLSTFTQPLEEIVFTSLDTVLVAGAYERDLLQVAGDDVVLEAIRRSAVSAERYGSVCTGAFVLGMAGVLEHKEVVTHWAGQDRLKEMFDHTVVKHDALYVHQGRLWTSAGITAGIDMALALLARDHGAVLKSQVAKQLLVYAHRPGYQSQFSELLTSQVKADEHTSKLVDWLSQRLDLATKVEHMAKFCGMSERTFHRHFVKTFEQTPAKFFERMRLYASREFLESGTSVKVVAGQVGFRSESAFRSAFRAEFGITPGLHRQMAGQDF